jgi:uncharacterized Tic20 family protein
MGNPSCGPRAAAPVDGFRAARHNDPVPTVCLEPRSRPMSLEEPKRIESTSEDRTMALFCHLGGAILGFLVPLIIWLIQKDKSRFVDDQGKEALNFQLTVLIGYVIGIATFCFIIGIFIFLATWVVNLVFGIIACVEAQKGNRYRYPIIIRFIS